MYGRKIIEMEKEWIGEAGEKKKVWERRTEVKL